MPRSFTDFVNGVTTISSGLLRSHVAVNSLAAGVDVAAGIAVAFDVVDALDVVFAVDVTGDGLAVLVTSSVHPATKTAINRTAVDRR